MKQKWLIEEPTINENCGFMYITLDLVKKCHVIKCTHNKSKSALCEKESCPLRVGRKG